MLLPLIAKQVVIINITLVITLIEICDVGILWVFKSFLPYLQDMIFAGCSQLFSSTPFPVAFLNEVQVHETHLLVSLLLRRDHRLCSFSEKSPTPTYHVIQKNQVHVLVLRQH